MKSVRVGWVLVDVGKVEGNKYLLQRGDSIYQYGIGMTTLYMHAQV